MADTENTDKVDDFLAHYGVKGMQWGKRMAARRESNAAREKKATDAGYTDKKRKTDDVWIGKSGQKSVVKKIDKGDSVGKARAKTYGQQTAIGIGVGAAYAVYANKDAILRGLTQVAKSQAAKRGAAAAANILADSRGLTSYNTFGMAFNAATNTWR